jgi:hypothetical protein
MDMDEQTDARLIDLESRVGRLESLILAYVQWQDQINGPLDWDKLTASPIGVQWFALWHQLFNEYEELPDTFDAPRPTA